MSITNFQQRVYKITALIPKGRVSTYQEIAIALGQPKTSRAVGNALNKNPYAPKVPCHRVVASDGRLGGYAGGIEKKAALLKREGVKIERNKINLKRFGYAFKK